MSRSRAPKVDEQSLEAAKNDTSEIDQLQNAFEQLEHQRKQGELNTNYIAFEVLTALLGARISGYSDTALRDVWPVDWGDSAIMLPAAVVETLARGWLTYKNEDHGRTLGEAFQIEGGGQGKAPMKSKQKTRITRKRIARLVEAQYVVNQVSQQAAREAVAKAEGLSFETVESAHKEHGPALRKKSRQAGITK